MRRLVPMTGLLATILLAACGEATPVATTGSPSSSVASPVASPPPRPAASSVTGFGALDADWNAHHTAATDPKLAPGCCYDLDPRLPDQPKYRYVTVDHSQGRVLGYMMVLPEGTTVGQARTLAMAELPSDASVVFYLVKNTCAILEAKSATLVPIMKAPKIGGDGTVDFVLSSVDSQGNASYNPKGINNLVVSLGLGLANDTSNSC
jgi:hypothetical protein